MPTLSNTASNAPKQDKPGTPSCPLSSRAQFLTQAKPITVTINGVPYLVPVKDFSTGSVGWYLNGKLQVECDGHLRPLLITVADRPIHAVPKEFGSGKHGWFANGKLLYQLPDGTIVQVQVGINLTIIKSEVTGVPNGIADVQIGGNFTVVGSKYIPATDLRPMEEPVNGAAPKKRRSKKTA